MVTIIKNNLTLLSWNPLARQGKPVYCFFHHAVNFNNNRLDIIVFDDLLQTPPISATNNTDTLRFFA